MRDEQILARLDELGLALPPPPAAIAAYVPCVVREGMAWVAGQVPMADGKPAPIGRLGDGVTVADGADGARRAALQALAVLRDALGSFDRLDRIVQVSVFVAATADFVEHPTVANGASELLVDVLGEAGRHARVAVGATSLPLGAAVEVAVTAALTP
ncbi:MAG: RidA family protein [Actinomycetota bacterium]